MLHLRRLIFSQLSLNEHQTRKYHVFLQKINYFHRKSYSGLITPRQILDIDLTLPYKRVFLISLTLSATNRILFLWNYETITGHDKIRCLRIQFRSVSRNFISKEAIYHLFSIIIIGTVYVSAETPFFKRIIHVKHFLINKKLHRHKNWI